MNILPSELGILVNRLPERSSSTQLCRFPISSGSDSSAFSERSSVRSAASSPILGGRPPSWFFIAEKNVSLVSRPKSTGSLCKLLWHIKRLLRLLSLVMQGGKALKLLKLRSRWARRFSSPSSCGKDDNNPLLQEPISSLVCPPASKRTDRHKASKLTRHI